MAYGIRRRQEEGGPIHRPAGPLAAVARTKAVRSCTLNGRNTHDPSAPEAEHHPPFFAGQNIVLNATHCAGRRMLTIPRRLWTKQTKADMQARGKAGRGRVGCGTAVRKSVQSSPLSMRYIPEERVLHAPLFNGSPFSWGLKHRHWPGSSGFSHVARCRFRHMQRRFSAWGARCGMESPGFNGSWTWE